MRPNSCMEFRPGGLACEVARAEVLISRMPGNKLVGVAAS